MNRGRRTKRVTSSSSSTPRQISTQSKKTSFIATLSSAAPFYQQQRSVVSYQTAKTTSDYTRHAKSVQKRGEKPQLKFQPVESKFSLSKTLEDGTIVQMFHEKTRTKRAFSPRTISRRKPKLDIETAPEFIHKLATTVASTPFEKLQVPPVTEPHYIPLKLLFRNPDKSGNQRTRRAALTHAARASIEQSKQDTQEYIQKIRSDISVDLDLKSTPEAPIEFGNDLALKFKVIDSVIRRTNIIVPASALNDLNNVNDVTDWVINKKKELDTKAEERSKPKTSDLPDNVTVSHVAGLDRTTRVPKWVKYQKIREKRSVAGA